MVLALLMLTSCKKDTEKVTTETALLMGDFTISSSNLTPGKTVSLTYGGTSDDVEGIYYYMVNTKAYPVDINLSKDNTTTITIPDSAQAIAFNLKIDNKYDHNDKKGYLFPLKSAEGKSITGSTAALSNYVLNYGSDFGIESDKAVLLGDIMKEVKNNPEMKDSWETSVLSSIYSQNKEKGENMINDFIASIKSKEVLTEKDYSAMIAMYKTLNNKELVESTSEEAIRKYPKGNAAKIAFRTWFSEAETLKEKDGLFDKYRKTFNGIGNTGNYMAHSLALAYLDEGDMDRFDLNANLIDNPSSKASLLNNIAWSHVEKNEELDFAAKLSKQSLDVLKEEEQNLTSKTDYLTTNQYKERLKNSYNMYADTYALILFKQGNIEDAITYQEQAIGDGMDGELNERYIEFLMKDEQFSTVIEKSELFIKNGNATRKIKEFYKAAFMKSNDDSNTFDAKLAALENEANKNLKTEIEATMINEDAPDFNLKNTNGKNVSLASLKGKTVILDFWATWCGPCKASFPGMQEVVTKYKEDDDVVLLFIDTFESGDNRENLVTEFIAKNKYDFHVIYDELIENSRDFEVAGKYGVSGIPTKIIIDKNGKMRFKSVGYSGQTEKLVKEMDIMIDLLKT